MGGRRERLRQGKTTLAGDQISASTRFDNSVLARFGLPASCPAERLT
jgi:hypothetical protein